MARISITITAPLPNFPLSIYESHTIGEATTEPFGVCDIVVGLTEAHVKQLILKSNDVTDTALAETSDALRFSSVSSYEAWFMQKRTPFALIHRETQSLMALVWMGPKPLGAKPPKLLSGGETIQTATSDSEVWDTMSFRSYPPYRGGGFMTDFVKHVLAEYCARYPNHRLWASIGAGNSASIALAGKLGFMEMKEVEQNDRIIMTLPTRLFVIDFDGTLFKTDAFWPDFREVCITDFGVDAKVFDETYAISKTKNNVYDIDAHLRALGVTQNKAVEHMHSLIEKHIYVFDDVASFFERHAYDTLVILTQGIEWFQKTKARALPAQNSVSEIVVTLDKKRDYILGRARFTDTGVVWEGMPYKSLTFIDNMAQAFVPKEQKHSHLHQYRIRRTRNEDRHATEDTPAHVTEINSLSQI